MQSRTDRRRDDPATDAVRICFVCVGATATQSQKGLSGHGLTFDGDAVAIYELRACRLGNSFPVFEVNVSAGR